MGEKSQRVIRKKGRDPCRGKGISEDQFVTIGMVRSVLLLTKDVDTFMKAMQLRDIK